MNERNGFLDWLKYRWKVISVSDRHFFTFIWTVAIAITVITVLITAGVSMGAEKKAKAEKAAKEKARIEAEQAAEEASETDALKMPAINPAEAWAVFLVNESNPLDSGYTVPEFTELRNDHKIDKRAYDDLQAMFDAAREAGHSPTITKSYEEAATGDSDLDSKMAELLDQGMTREQAMAEVQKQTGEVVTSGVTSEHATGLAVDISSEAGEEDEKALMDWFKEHAHEYGFIVRYPEDKAVYTGVTDDKNHLRYVGKTAAGEMHASGQCLEEYFGR